MESDKKEESQYPNLENISKIFLPEIREVEEEVFNQVKQVFHEQFYNPTKRSQSKVKIFDIPKKSNAAKETINTWEYKQWKKQNLSFKDLTKAKFASFLKHPEIFKPDEINASNVDDQWKPQNISFRDLSKEKVENLLKNSKQFKSDKINTASSSCSLNENVSPSHDESDDILKSLLETYDRKKDDKYEAAQLSLMILNQLNTESRKGNISKCLLRKLQENCLLNYTQIVDDIKEGGLNNYSKEIQSSIKSSCNPQCHTWKSHFKKANEKDFANYIPNNLKESDNGMSLGSLNIEDFKNISLESEDEIFNYVTQQINTIVLNSSPDVVEKITGINPEDSDNDDEKKNTLIEHISSISEKKKLPINIPAPKRKTFTQTSILDMGSSSIMPNKNKESTYVNKKFTGNMAKRKKLEEDEITVCNPPKEEKPLLSFKTAKAELHLQQSKSNVPRKTLGSRGINSKFITPIAQPAEEDNTKEIKKTEEIQDERLKGIDPKMIEIMMSEIMDHDSAVAWDDIAGLEFIKKTLKEIVVWPLLRPDIFTGLRGPPKGILLFGPPGTGKTLIGKCVASQSKSTFFSISASSLGSKWYGEGEKLVRALFTVARCYQPAVIFIDEIDSLLIQRSDHDHEQSRRVKTEFLVQLDGVKTLGDERLLIIGATNRPQELDEAARRRLVKRLYVPLPEPSARIQIVKTLLANQSHNLSESDFNILMEKTEGYSGADMANLCKEAALGPIRSIQLEDIASVTCDQVRPICLKDFIKALNQVRASVSDTDLNLYQEWNKKFGSIFTEHD